MPVSCLPCTKRKVRCDREKPCSHCKRRGDVCEYPNLASTSRNSPRTKAVGTSESRRIEKLEEYIRRLGGDPNHIQSSARLSPTPLNERSSLEHALSVDKLIPDQETGRHEGGSSSTPITSFRNSEQARLVEHNEETTYVEAPVWYSWSEAKRLVNSNTESSGKHDHQGFCTTLLDPINTDSGAVLCKQHPTSLQVSELWTRYLSNIHPLTKLFFDWEKEPLLRKAANHPHSISKAEESFCFALYYITILSLSAEECQDVMSCSKRYQLLDNFQSFVETALLAAEFITTSDLVVLQAFLLYLIAMRNRARPAAWFSLMGIAVRIAQRMGLHRDGSILGLQPAQAEERRRVWWQMQHMEIMISQLIGCLSMTLYADWDTKLPSNLEDGDFCSNFRTLPSDHRGLTSMSSCLWRYQILYQQRLSKNPDSPQRDFTWLTSSSVSMTEKDAFIEQTASMLREKFIQHCELLNPLHVSIQIGINSFILVMKRLVHQPAVANIRISAIPQQEREDLLKNSIGCLEYYILAETTTSIAKFRWFNENFFQWIAFVYVIIEAHHRATSAEASSLWILIDKICVTHPKLRTFSKRPDTVAIGRLIVLAWYQREEHLQKSHQQVERPWCVIKMEEELRLFVGGSSMELGNDLESFSPLDFDCIDWSAWERDGFVKVLR